MELCGAAALVTGGAAGIGRAIAVRLAADGARVAVADIDEDAGRETVASLGEEAVFLQADLSLEDDVRRTVSRALAELGGLDVLVNNAGGASQAFPGAPLSEWLWTLDLNLRASMIATHLAVEAMLERGRGGAVVNVSSVAGLGTRAYGLPDYAAAKAGLVRFTASLAGLGESDGIRVACICPDYVDTPAVRRSLARMSEADRAEVPPLVPAEEIAELVADLVRDDASAGRIVVRFADEPGPRELPLGLRG
jgi:NAD(P)-dependent dehydrogenase (short-subunit alcohol dehydrogenase family)